LFWKITALLRIFLETFSDRSCLLLLLLLLSRRAKKLRFDLWSSIIYYYILYLHLPHFKIFFSSTRHVRSKRGHTGHTTITTSWLVLMYTYHHVFILSSRRWVTRVWLMRYIIDIFIISIICESWLYIFIFRMYNK